MARLAGLCLRTRTAVATVCFERYVRIRGLEDETIWELLEHMWELPCAVDLDLWEMRRGDLADFGLGDELPEELEEELCELGIDEDYFECWVTALVETVWPSVLRGPQREESLIQVKKILEFSLHLGMGLPDLDGFEGREWTEDGWGPEVTAEGVTLWKEVGEVPVEVVGVSTLESIVAPDIEGEELSNEP